MLYEASQHFLTLTHHSACLLSRPDLRHLNVISFVSINHHHNTLEPPLLGSSPILPVLGRPCKLQHLRLLRPHLLQSFNFFLTNTTFDNLLTTPIVLNPTTSSFFSYPKSQVSPLTPDFSTSFNQNPRCEERFVAFRSYQSISPDAPSRQCRSICDFEGETASTIASLPSSDVGSLAKTSILLPRCSTRLLFR
ncbi:hypothetical protein VTL71DRAFT_9013 [Oculimacula yallundae]|uniref:Uncharacterized protein n=1 Tax=Oculimacula yallundae TaxID=86028 RepID=A0ABR4BV19_9HELO